MKINAVSIKQEDIYAQVHDKNQIHAYMNKTK